MPNMQSPNQVSYKYYKKPNEYTHVIPIFSLQRKYLEQIEDLYCDFHITKIPLFETEVRGISRLHHMSNLLAPGNEKG